jgi:hypothetical protein
MNKFLIALLLTTSAYGESLPDAPKPHDYVEWSLIATDVTLRGLDAYSTRKVLTAPCHCNHEDVLPDFISHSTGMMIGYSATVVGFDYLLSTELKKHGHNKLSKFVYVVDISVEAPTLHNFSLRTK